MSWSGGKDSMLALDRARADGLDVRFLLTMFDAGDGRVRFHGAGRELLQRQAEALGCELVAIGSSWEDFDACFREGLRRLRERGVTGLILGNVHLADVRAWYERRTADAGLDHVEPLWGRRPEELTALLLRRGYRARVVSVDIERAHPAWLGRELDAELLCRMQEAGIDVAGEHGEYHTFVLDGPLFSAPVAVRSVGMLEHPPFRTERLDPGAGEG